MLVGFCTLDKATFVATLVYVRFEWDETKRRRNLSKHGIDFVDAVRVFAGLTISALDERRDYGEERFVTLGFLEGVVIYVAHTDGGDVIRVISMRKATKNETSIYLSQIGHGLEEDPDDEG